MTWSVSKIHVLITCTNTYTYVTLSVFFWQFSSSHMTNNYQCLKQELHWCITNTKSNCTEEITRLRSAQDSYKHHTLFTQSSSAKWSSAKKGSAKKGSAKHFYANTYCKNVKECKQHCNCVIVQARLDLEMETAKRSLVFRQSRALIEWCSWIWKLFIDLRNRWSSCAVE